MKYCPSCGTQYTDDTLRFCLQDGSPLTEGRATGPPTVVLDETPTVVQDRTPAAVTRDDVRTENPEDKRSLLVPFMIAGIVGTILFIAGAAAAWYLLSGKQDSANNNNSLSADTNSSPVPSNRSSSVSTTSPKPSASPVPSSTQTPTGKDIEQARTDISRTIDQWKTNTENLDLNSYMENYADVVDYYNRTGASRSQVRNDKARAFGMYRSISIEMSNMNITVDERGNRATAEFDKEWDFRGDRDSSGKVRSELRFRREGDRWLITGERDIKVFYVN